MRSTAWLLLVLLFAPAARAAETTVVTDAAAKQRLLGTHLFSLQWVSWDRFGRATVTERGGTLYITGEQRAAKGGDYVTIDGVITRIDATEFTFRGKIVTCVSFNNDGKPCERDGEYVFAITGKRAYWRLQSMNSPCEDVVDYVDIYFRKSGR